MSRECGCWRTSAADVVSNTLDSRAPSLQCSCLSSVTRDALEGLVRTGTMLNFGIASTAFVMICLLGGGMYTGVTTTASIGGLVTAVLVALTCTVTHMCFMWVSADIKNEVQFGDNGGAGNSKDEEGDGSGTLPTWGTSLSLSRLSLLLFALHKSTTLSLSFSLSAFN